MKQVRKKVLYIDQNPSMGMVIRTVLNDFCLVKIVPNAFDAMDELIKGKTNCVILSIEKDNTQSLIFLRQLQSSSLLKNVPTMVISDYDERRLKTICRKNQVYKYFKKPLNPVLLAESVRSLSHSVDTSQILLKRKEILNLN